MASLPRRHENYQLRVGVAVVTFDVARIEPDELGVEVAGLRIWICHVVRSTVRSITSVLRAVAARRLPRCREPRVCPARHPSPAGERSRCGPRQRSTGTRRRTVRSACRQCSPSREQSARRARWLATAVATFAVHSPSRAAWRRTLDRLLAQRWVRSGGSDLRSAAGRHRSPAHATDRPARQRQYGARSSANIGKCRVLRVSSREPPWMAVAAIARPAPSML